MIRTIADIADLEAALPDPAEVYANTYEMFVRSAATWPTATAMSFFGQTEDFRSPSVWSYQQLLDEITRTANCFRRLGVGRGDVIAYVLPNLPETHFTIWGGETAGIVFAVNPSLDGPQIGQLLKAANVRWLVTTTPDSDAENWQRVTQALAHADTVSQLILVDPLHHAASAPGGGDQPKELLGRPILNFHTEVAKESAAALNFPAPLADDIASYLCTGGTTGLPKIARHTQRNKTANALQLIAVSRDMFMMPGRAILTALPLFHVNAQIGTGLAAFASGVHVVLAPPAGYRSPGLIANFWAIAEHYRLSSFSGVPTIYSALMQVPVAGRDLSSLTYALCGAAPLPIELAQRVEKETGLHILEGYGLTETTCVASINPGDGRARIGSIGFRLPWEQMRAAILGAGGEFERWAEVDEVGAICMSGPNVIPGYLDDAHNQNAFFAAPGSDGAVCRWLNSGDLGRQDAEGYFWLTGRKKELIIRGGHNIDPKTIEEAMASHPAVLLTAAVGRPDAYAGEVPVAYVQLRAGSTVSETELLEHAFANIGERAAIPKSIRTLPALPVTAVGKIFKPALTMMEVESVVREEASRIGVTLAYVKVLQDPKLGILAQWSRAAGDAAALTSALGAHVFKNQQVATVA